VVEKINQIEFSQKMLQINPKKFKQIQNKAIPSPLRPKFRNRRETNIYFLSKRKLTGEKRDLLIKKIKILVLVIFIGFSGYILSN
tara:strand:+ start:255 stop:509 length:255 start_codon:yes stop_codon:yes gene_type:complete